MAGFASNVAALTPYPMIVRYWPVPESCIPASDDDPYSPAMGRFAPEPLCGKTREFTKVALVVPFGVYWNSVSGAP